MNAATTAADRPAKGTRFTTEGGSEWVVTSVRKQIGGTRVLVHGTPADAYDSGSRTGVFSWDLAVWSAILAPSTPAAARPAVTVAAEPARDEITVAVEDAPADAAETECPMCRYYVGHTSWCPRRPLGDVEDAGDDVAQCGIFGHEMAGGACEVCGQPDPAVAPTAAQPGPVLRTVRADEVRIGSAISVVLEGGRTAAGTVTARTDYRRDAGDTVVLQLDDRSVVTLLAGDPVGVTRHAADVALGTLASEPGGFGAALAGLGFGEFTSGDSWGGAWHRTEHVSDCFRVICYPDDGQRVVLIGWDPTRRTAKLEAWRVAFDGSTPQSVVLAAIANAVGDLPVTR